jgi:CrcB protein
MTWTLALVVAAGGAIGAPLRLLLESRITRSVSDHRWSAFPWGLLVVNALGSLLIGIVYVVADEPWRALLATGGCGALTTYSGYAYFVHRTWDNDRSAAWWAIVAMPVMCITACAFAVLVTRAIVA